MYTIDEQDRAVARDDIPAHSAGAPMPLVVANDGDLMLSYKTAPEGLERVALRFIAPRAHYLGPPNDEALAGHPLSSQGLKPYGIFEVTSSSWVRSLERTNRVHPQHDPCRFEALRHLIFTFHDSTFECIAEEVTIVARLSNDGDDVGRVLRDAAQWLRQR